MSPSWLDRLGRIGALRPRMPRETRDILLAPYRVDFVHQINGRATETLALDCIDEGAGAWPTALSTLHAGLQQLAWHDTAVRVRLSNHFVRYALIPSLAQLRNRDERMAAARHHLSAIYGERAEHWQVALNDGGRAGTAIAAGTDQHFMQQLVALLAEARLELQAIEPLTAMAFNAVRRDIDRSPTWFGVAEPGRIALAYLENREWRFLQVERLRSDLAQTLRPLLERSQLAHGAQPGRVLLVADEDANVELEHSAGWSLEWRRLAHEVTQEPVQ